MLPSIIESNFQGKSRCNNLVEVICGMLLCFVLAIGKKQHGERREEAGRPRNFVRLVIVNIIPSVSFNHLRSFLMGKQLVDCSLLFARACVRCTFAAKANGLLGTVSTDQDY